MRAVLCILCSLFACAAASCQEPAVAASIAELAQPQRAAVACQALQQQGEAAVAPLRQLLLRANGADPPGEYQLTMALYVLGRLGPLGVPALPEVRDVYFRPGPAALRNQAMWALGELALASRDPRACAAAAELLRAQWTRGPSICGRGAPSGASSARSPAAASQPATGASTSSASCCSDCCQPT